MVDPGVLGWQAGAGTLKQVIVVGKLQNLRAVVRQTTEYPGQREAMEGRWEKEVPASHYD